MRRLLLPLLLIAAAARPGDLHWAADRPFDLLHLALTGSVDLKGRNFDATARLAFVALRPMRLLRLDAVRLDVRTVQVARAEPAGLLASKWTNDGRFLDIAFEAPLATGTRIDVAIDYRCHEPEDGLYFFGPTEAQPEVPYQVWSQGETEGTRHWIPILDHPNERLTSELSISVESGLKVLSNGSLGGVATRDGREVWHWKQEKDHVPYLITLVVGHFEVEREEWRGIPVEYWVPPKRKNDIARSFGNTKRMLDFFSDRIGVPYPWAKYSQIVVEQFGWGGMENTTATTLNERTLHDERAHLDYSSDGLVAHELAHQWFGDLLTCREWAHTWLNEGFATYFEALWDEEDKGRDEFLYNMLGKARGAISGGQALPIVHRGYNGPWEQFDARAYPKGAWVLHMIRRRLGDALWWKCVNRYVTDNAHRCVESDDLRRAIEATTGRAFEEFFHEWTGRPGHPVVEVHHNWDEQKKIAELRVVQTQKGEPFRFPLRVQFETGAPGGAGAVEFDLSEREMRWVVPLPGRPTRIRVDPDHALLMELREHKGRDLWIAQLSDEADPLARIRAAEQLGEWRRDEDRAALGEALGKEPFWGVQAEICKALGACGGDASRDILLRALSLEHPKARRAAVEALGRFREDDTARSALEAIVRNGDGSYYVEAAAIGAWAALRPSGALEVLTPLLGKESHNEVVREAVLNGIGDQLDPASTDLLLRWTARERPRPCRQAALGALAKLGRSGTWTAEQTSAAVAAITRCLHRLEHRGIKGAAAQALRDVGERGAAALPALEALAAHDPFAHVRNEAKAAIDRIRSGAPAHVELGRLREELGKMREEGRKLSERLERMERKVPLGSSD